jgi:hypothetical protein
MAEPIVLVVNGKPHNVEAEAETPLLYVLRNEPGAGLPPSSQRPPSPMRSSTSTAHWRTPAPDAVYTGEGTDGASSEGRTLKRLWGATRAAPFNESNKGECYLFYGAETS